MPDPVNYLAQLQPVAPINPLQSFTQGLGVGQNFAQQRLAAEKAKADLARQAQISDAFAKLSMPGATAKDYMNLAMMLPEEQSKAIRESFSLLRDEEREAALQSTTGIYTALRTGNKDVAVKLIKTQAEAARNAGDEDTATIMSDWASLAERDEAGAKTVEDLFGFTIAQMPGGDKAIESAMKFAAEPTVQLKRLADIGYTEAQTNKLMAETKKLGLESDQIVSEIEKAKKALPAGISLSAAAEKNVNDAVLLAAKANSLAAQYTTLAADFDKAITTAGVGARLTEQISKIFGTEKEPTALRQEFLRLRNTAVLEMLPPGVASDKDIEIALAAFPTETSAPANIAGFLRGMSKLQAYEGAVNNAQAEWIQQNGTLGTARASMKVGNRTVNLGDKFTDFIKSYVPNTSVLTPGGAGATYGASSTSEAMPAASSTQTTEVDF